MNNFEQSSPEHEAAANAFNEQRQRDAEAWNNQQQGTRASSPPITAALSGEAEINPAVMPEVADTWRSTTESTAEPETETATDNVRNISDHPNYPGFKDSETNDATGSQETAEEPEEPQSPAGQTRQGSYRAPHRGHQGVAQEVAERARAIREAQFAEAMATMKPSSEQAEAAPPKEAVTNEQESTMQEVGEVIAAEALHPIEAAQKSSELIDSLLDNPEAFQKNTIDIINFMSTPGLSANSKERMSSILLQELQNPDRPIDIDSINPYLAALATMKGQQSELWQSTLQAEGERVLEAKYDYIRKNRKSVALNPAAASSTSGVPARTAYEVAEAKTGGPINTAETEPETDEAVPVQPQPTPEAPTPVPTQAEQSTPETNVENERIQAEIEAEEEQNQQLTNDIQAGWRNLPPSAQNSLALANVPKTAGFLDLNGFKAQLEQRMQASHLRANEQFAGLDGDEPEKVLARKKRINQEYQKLLQTIEKAKLNSSEVVEGVAKANEIQTKYAQNAEKMQSKLEDLFKKYPWAQEFVKFDPHVQRNKYFSRFGDNEL